MTIEVSVKQTDALTAPELLAILKARVKVFVVEQQCPYQEVDDQDDQAYHLVLRENGQLVGYTRIMAQTDEVHFGRVLVPKEYRQRQLGRQLIASTLAEIKQSFPGKPVKIGAQNYLRAFYESFGFEAVSDVYLEDEIPHIEMVLK
ncbi:Protein ElaA [Latilactobacillus fuchuensis]|uniref:Protein ElaA n=1 Tax=Latilactobacillus fuchuensis TaxID=164393 RepID=A0A2N9DXT5_9LACO|nr:Protein ElaA [Latilactobacillus fuchuensis]